MNSYLISSHHKLILISDLISSGFRLLVNIRGIHLEIPLINLRFINSEEIKLDWRVKDS